MSKGTRIKEILTEEEYSGILYEDMDEAMVGIYRARPYNIVPVYSYIKYIELLVNRGMSEEEAIEYTDSHVFPVDGSTPFVNQLTRPIIIDDTGV
jgi:hypothetical protein|tara:strand:- start:1269 stop:1553 length:285 start_codon:yes stop_codon:yes gene_type:complete